MKKSRQLNVALPRLLIETLPSLFEEDFLLRSTPCSLEYPKDCSELCVALTGFVSEETDICWLGSEDNVDIANGILCNAGSHIGIPLDKNRRKLIQSAMNGIDTPFRGLGESPGDIAERMVAVTMSVCHVIQNDDNVFVGDCEDCYKRLGRGCIAATWIRDYVGYLVPDIQDRRMVPATKDGRPIVAAGRGNKTNMYTGGQSKNKKQKMRQCHPMIRNNFKTYLASLDVLLLADVATELCLFLDKDGNTLSRYKARLKGKDHLLSSVLSFLDNPKKFRDSNNVI